MHHIEIIHPISKHMSPAQLFVFTKDLCKQDEQIYNVHCRNQDLCLK